MIFSAQIKRIFITVFALVLIGSVVPAQAVKVQVFQPADPEQEIPQRVLREKGVTMAFAQALFSEATHLIPISLSPERGEVLRQVLGKHYEDYITGYKDMDVRVEETGVSVSVDVNINRSVLREALHGMGMFSAENRAVETVLAVSNGKYTLNPEQQLDQDNEINSLMTLYALANATESVGNGTAVVFNVDHVAKTRWSGDLRTAENKWFASGPDMETVWKNLWSKYYASGETKGLSNPRAVLSVKGWFTPDGVREFDRRLKSWDSAVLDVQLLDVEMKPTAVSASWSLEVSDQWILKSNLNDYLPLRGLSYTLDGLEEEQ